jgi:hypothetical protein
MIAEPPQSVKFKVAGSDWEATTGAFKGVFNAIPLDLWNAIVGFHRQISINESAESVTYHRWHGKSQAYHTLIPYQTTTQHGLSVKVDWAKKENVALLDAYAKKFGEEFLPACTIHTHVDVAAFESGTDAGDEREAPGWHITLGHLISRDQFDMHCRMRVPATRSLKAIINTSCAYSLQWNNLFAPANKLEEWLLTTPGTKDFHHLLNRVHAS